MKGITPQYGYNVKSIHSAGIRSIPKAQRSVYLDLYVLSREKIRLEKELQALDTRNKSSKNRMAMLGKRMAKLHEELQQKENKDSQEQKTKLKKPLKTLVLNY